LKTLISLRIATLLLLIAGPVNAWSCYSKNQFSYCTGDVVVNDQGVLGTIRAVFQTGDVMVAYSGHDGIHKWPTSRLAVTKGCASRKICVGEKIVNDQGVVGRVKAILSRTEVMVGFEGHDGFHKWPTSRLGKTNDCANRYFCTGVRTISDTGVIGRITGILPDKEVMVAFDGHDGNHQWPISRLAVVKGCTSDNFCATDKIISDTGVEGVIRGILRSGEVMIAFAGHDGFHKWPTSRLAVTEACTERPVINF